MTNRYLPNFVSPSRFATVELLACVGSWGLDIDTGFLDISPQAEALLTPGASALPSTLTSRESMLERIAEMDRGSVVERWQSALCGMPYEVEYRLQSSHRDTRWVREAVRLECDAQGHPRVAVGVVQDITAYRTLRGKLEDGASDDPVSELPSRSRVMEHLQSAIELAGANGSKFALLFVTLKQLDRAHWEHGYLVVDEVLRQTAQRLKRVLRQSDLIGRKGSDDFIVLIQDLEYESDAGLVALRLIEAFSQGIEVDGQCIKADIRIGATIFPNDGADVPMLMGNAELAIASGRHKPRMALSFYDRTMREVLLTRRAMDDQLRHALEAGQFILHYQPIYSFGAQCLYGAEALIRWNHPERGLVGPDHFIPAAEKSGLICDIGKWVILEVCRQLQSWQEAGQDPFISVNVSSRQIPDSIPVHWLQSCLKKFNIHPSKLIFEVTESSLIEESSETQDWIEEVAAMGIKLSLDDFGTGYASLGFLRRFKMHNLKLDKSFVLNLAEDSSQLAMVKAILGIGSSLGLSVTAEGVEDLATLNLLQTLGCSFAQGYHFSRPIPPEELCIKFAESQRGKL